MSTPRASDELLASILGAMRKAARPLSITDLIECSGYGLRSLRRGLPVLLQQRAIVRRPAPPCGSRRPWLYTLRTPS